MNSSPLTQIKRILTIHFDLRQEKEDEQETIDSLKKGVEFRGTNLWVLIFAIFLASLGLNTNSTAVIIGAMLISPLMGPIMGFGLGLGIADFDLVKRSLRNYLTATLFSVVTATIYFLISPISEAQSELLARTSPTIYDVLIAFFGGLAGIVAGSTKSKGNVIPGVAIATALMPPLCTAGFGLATGNLSYFLGAFYLYFINTVFISLSTYIVVRVLKYPHKEFLDKKRAMVVRRYMMVIVTCTIIPSLYLTYRVLRNTVFDEQVRSFVNKELDFPNTQVLSRTVAVDTAGRKALNVVLLGDEVPDMMIEAARARMTDYGLGGIGLNIQQGFGSDVEQRGAYPSAGYADRFAQAYCGSLSPRLSPGPLADARAARTLSASGALSLHADHHRQHRPRQAGHRAFGLRQSQKRTHPRRAAQALAMDGRAHRREEHQTDYRPVGVHRGALSSLEVVMRLRRGSQK